MNYKGSLRASRLDLGCLEVFGGSARPQGPPDSIWGGGVWSILYVGFGYFLVLNCFWVSIW